MPKIRASPGRQGVSRASNDAQCRPPTTNDDQLYRQLTALIRADTRYATDESTCTPGSVPRTSRYRVAAIHLGLPSPAGSSGLPAGHRTGRPRAPAQVTTSRRGPSWPCSGWGLPSHPGHPGCWWDSYPTVHSPLPTASAGRSPRRGGLFSVALSRGSPRVAINNHPALWSPDVPRQSLAGPTRPPGRLVRRRPILPRCRGAGRDRTRCPLPTIRVQGDTRGTRHGQPVKATKLPRRI